ncbi:BgTH12-05181 [Blumeria graminis f. sp. triticale]|uniref:Bgt-55134 n=2 Tax=Blumeria graminis TaxID=34373 RepID=A0A9X9QCU6_BLUGR|nr:BgTH12-05181 [Blumeria graminis f. sp. triticale]VDB88007.1 Bgt-55134 [Blumeria graminis f. sp. tritici]
MRFSSIAIIFQSASIFATTLASGGTDRSYGPSKNFDCEGRKLYGSDLEPFRQEGARRILNRQVQKINDYNILRQLNWGYDRNSFSCVNGKPAAYYLHRLEGYTHSQPEGKWVNEIDYMLVLDGLGHTCTMMMKRFMRHHTTRAADVPIEDSIFDLCSITS